MRATSLPNTVDVRGARRVLPLLATTALATAWAVGFGYLAVARHLAGGSHAEDLGFTDQVIWNFLRGQWFRMSVYNGATWNTELDLSRLARPDSLLSFHVEPMLLAFVPLYALGAGAVALLMIQSAAVAAGALPAYQLGRSLSGSAFCGLAVAVSYLLSPLGQWAVLADFHTSTLAGPLLLLSLERLLVARQPRHAVGVAVLAATAREDVGPVLVCLGLGILLIAPTSVGANPSGRTPPAANPSGRTPPAADPSGRIPRWVGPAYLLIGLAWSIFALLVIRSYSGGQSPFETRYAVSEFAQLLARPAVGHYAATLLLSGAWLGLLSPFGLLPALPSLAFNVLSSSPWMASGQAHYSGLVLPFITLGAAAGLARLRHTTRLLHGSALLLVTTGVVGYLSAGAGPLAANYAPALVTDHALHAAAIAEALPPDAAVTATSALVPRLSHRPKAYIFPTLLDADYVFLDLDASPAPTSAGDVYLRVQSLLDSGDWHVQTSEDGLLLLARGAPAEPPTAPASPSNAADVVPPQPRLLSAALVPSPDAAVGVDGPLWILRTTWQTSQPLPPGTHLEFWLSLRSGERVHVWDLAPLWWNPPQVWPIAQPITVDVPGVPVREFVSWTATWSSS